MLEMLYGNVPDTLSQLIRTSFIASPGHRLIVADLSAIEARIIAWLAGEKWRLNVFQTHGKIYEASASQMFKVPIESVTKASPLRQKGKISELALGYGGGPNALITMGALKMGIPEEELPKLVAMWRNSNRAIVNYWKAVELAAIRCVEGTENMTIPHGISFSKEKEIMFINLPSGRKLSYLRPALKPNRFNNGDAIVYEGMDQTTKQWKRIETYGGKLVENIVQAVARDVLAEGMLKLDAAGYKIILHVHDEVVMEMPDGQGSVEETVKIMASPVPWAKGLPLDADGFETIYYKK
jgi:DNA polymerase